MRWRENVEVSGGTACEFVCFVLSVNLLSLTSIDKNHDINRTCRRGCTHT